MNKNTILKLAIFFFIAFFLVAANLNDAGVVENDANVGEFVVNNQVYWLTGICSVLSVIFEPIYVIVFVLLLSFILWIEKYRNESLFLIFVSGFAGVAIYLLKHLFVRARPLIQFFVETGYSFPSGHALISIVLFGSIAYFGLKIKNNFNRVCVLFGSFLGIFVLGMSRVYLNVHWFSDVIGGYFLGAMILFIGIFFYKSSIFQKLIILFYPK